MNNETKILSRREAVEILGKLYNDQKNAGEWRRLTDDEMNALNIAIFCIEKDIYEQENKTAEEWTPIEKGLPSVDGWYFVTVRGKDGLFIGTDIFQKDRDGGFLFHRNEVTAWMPKEPYKGGAIS